MWRKLLAAWIATSECFSSIWIRRLYNSGLKYKLFELERFMAQVYEENGRCEAAEVAALCLANLYNSGGHRKITPDEYSEIFLYQTDCPQSSAI